MLVSIGVAFLASLIFLQLLWFCIERFRNRKAKAKVGVIYLRGMIVGDEALGAAPDLISFDVVKQKLNGIDTQNLAALIINISSPGGLPVQTDRISTFLKARFANIPIICFIEEMAASGGYWLACTAQEIYATR